MPVPLCHMLCKTAVFSKTGNQNEPLLGKKTTNSRALSTTDIQARVALNIHHLLSACSNRHLEFKDGLKLKHVLVLNTLTRCEHEDIEMIEWMWAWGRSICANSRVRHLSAEEHRQRPTHPSSGSPIPAFTWSDTPWTGHHSLRRHTHTHHLLTLSRLTCTLFTWTPENTQRGTWDRTQNLFCCAV